MCGADKAATHGGLHLKATGRRFRRAHVIRQPGIPERSRGPTKPNIHHKQLLTSGRAEVNKAAADEATGSSRQIWLRRAAELQVATT